jgi:GTP 3',8-cyclase
VADLSPPIPPLVDPCGRAITYARLSVTDRCDLRCVYCMSTRPRFLPRQDLLSLEELDRLVGALVGLGVSRLRLTGGEPLVRHGVLGLVERLGRHLRSGALAELALTTNGTLLAGAAAALARAGVRRVNVSLDSLEAEVYRRVTRRGELPPVLAGIEAATAAGLEVKLNVVVLRDENEAELPGLVRWAHARGCAVSLIEVMPVGEIGADRQAQFVSLAAVRAGLERQLTLLPEARQTPGPSRYFRVLETGGTLGFITPLSHRFCEACNRVRITCTGILHPCLGSEDGVDLRTPLRGSADDGPLVAAIRQGVARKPPGHAFAIGPGPAAAERAMSVTGG